MFEKLFNGRSCRFIKIFNKLNRIKAVWFKQR